MRNIKENLRQVKKNKELVKSLAVLLGVSVSTLLYAISVLLKER